MKLLKTLALILVLSLGLCHPAQADSTNAEKLMAYAWQIHSLNLETMPSEQPPYFAFFEDGKFYGFGECNYFAGSYKLAEDGSFLISKMQVSRALCPQNSALEVKMMGSLLMSSRMQIEERQLVLYTNSNASDEEKVSVVFEASEQIDRQQLRKQASHIGKTAPSKTRKNQLRKKSAVTPSKAKSHKNKPSHKVKAKRAKPARA